MSELVLTILAVVGAVLIVVAILGIVSRYVMPLPQSVERRVPPLEAGEWRSSPRCGFCGKPTSMIRLLGALAKRDGPYRDPTTPIRLIYQAVDSNLSRRGEITLERAERIMAGMTEPYRTESVLHAELPDHAGYCISCERFYCQLHWRLPIARCPNAHPNPIWTSDEDPHWHPDDPDY